MTTSAVQYTLRRLNWRRSGHGWYRLPGTTRIASFADPESAERERARLEDQARAAINPFRCGTSLFDRTSFDEGRLCDWLLDIGLTPPEPPPMRTRRDWAAWWGEMRKSMSDYQRGRVWEALDRVRFHEVIEGPVRPVVYVVVEIPWHYTDEDYFAGEEGGAPRLVFRSRYEAVIYCTIHFANLGAEPADMTTRRNLQADPLGIGLAPRSEEWFDDGGAPRYDIVEVEVVEE